MKRTIKLPFGYSVVVTRKEFGTTVWIGTQFGGIFVGKDHS